MTGRKIKVSTGNAAAEGSRDQQAVAQNTGPPQTGGEGDSPDATTVDPRPGDMIDADDPDAPAGDISLEQRLQTAAADRDENHNKWLRAEAELDNYRKRVRRETEELRLYQAFSLARDLLPVLDNLHRALAANADAAAPTNGGELVQGVEMVARQLQDTLARHHVVPIEAIGEAFDPNVHDALQQVPSDDAPPMAVVEVVEPGYKLHDRVVRPSKVIVSSGARDPDK